MHPSGPRPPTPQQDCKPAQAQHLRDVSASGNPSGSFILVLATTQTGDYVIQPWIDGQPLGQPLGVAVAPGLPELNRCVVVLQDEVQDKTRNHICSSQSG